MSYQFKPTTSQINFPELEKLILSWWYSSGVVEKYLSKNIHSSKRFSFLDGPITANNPMGVHHAWGRTYKDIFQRYHTMKGEAERFQNGFDCQGLWVEVEVEKELGFKFKKDIEAYGVANFVNKCKERVKRYSSIQTEQSKRLGYFMDWDNSYFTMSDENNYSIWNFLKICWGKGWIYKGQDSVPWCPRCETAISQHEMLTEDYKEINHKSVFLSFPVVDRAQEFLLVWTTTPWTVPANIAIAVNTKIEYGLFEAADKNKYWVALGTEKRSLDLGSSLNNPIEIKKGSELVGLKYTGPFDALEAVSTANKSEPDKFHTVIPTDDLIMPISVDEGTGLVHTAVSAGGEDFKLGKKLGLPLIPVIADNADYLPGLGFLSGQNAKKHPEIILDYLTENKFAYKITDYLHRYPACWRCKTELVWKVADEWYIAMDKADPFHPKGLTYRQQMKNIVTNIHWLPSFGKERELDWLDNMHDWLISKKNRYWGLALPIYECPNCGKFQVIGSKSELQTKAISGWELFEGNSPHKPWIDEVRIKCNQCSAQVARILDVGNPWLDAGIVANSTLPSDWYPADFITESFPGQFKNWFYALIAMSTVLSKSKPFKNVLGFASLLAEDGRPMHKSWGNAIEFNEGADAIGVDVMRWMYINQNPEDNLLFGYKKADETRRRFHLMLWNIYNFFITYALLDKYRPAKRQRLSPQILDRWIIARLKETSKEASRRLNRFEANYAAKYLEEFVNDLSLWYVRRSRDRIGPSVNSSKDKKYCYDTLYSVLVNLSKLLAPFIPYLSEEMYKNLTNDLSVHLTSWPRVKSVSSKEIDLVEDMKTVRKVVELGLAQRKALGIKVRQPLAAGNVTPPHLLDNQLLELIQDEINIKTLTQNIAQELTLTIDKNLTPDLIEEGKTRELIRQIQDTRKNLNAKLDQHITISSPYIPSSVHLLEILKRQTLTDEVTSGPELEVKFK